MLKKVTNTLMKYSPLIRAAKTGHTEDVRLILDRLNPQKQEDALTHTDRKSGKNALMWAISEAHTDTTKYILDIIDQNKHLGPLVQVNKKGSSALTIAAYNGNKEIIDALITVLKNFKLDQRLLRQADKKGLTPLLFAVKKNNTSALGAILDMMSPTEQTTALTTPHSADADAIMIAAYRGHPKTLAILLDVLKGTSKLPAGLYQSDTYNGSTALMFAASAGDIPSLTVILDAMQDSTHLYALLKQTNNDGRTALMLAASNGHQNAAHLLGRAEATCSASSPVLEKKQKEPMENKKVEKVKEESDDSCTSPTSTSEPTLLWILDNHSKTNRKNKRKQGKSQTEDTLYSNPKHKYEMLC